MVKKIGIVAVLVVFIIIGYFFTLYRSFASPTPFPGNKQLIKELNRSFPIPTIQTIQGTVHIDSRHVYVPFITNENQYGFSCWIWNKHKWEQTAINTMGEPFLWKINEKDPSTYRFIWNLHPGNKVSYIQFYLMRDSDYHIIEGTEYYSPKIQMRKGVSVSEKSYGYTKLPKDWIAVMNSFYKVAAEEQPDLLFANFFPQSSIYFGWKSFDNNGKKIRIQGSANGNGFGRGGGDIDTVRFLSEEGKDY